MYEYYCTKCEIKITSNDLEYIECHNCESGDHIRDFGDHESPIWEDFKDDYNWNKP